MESTYTWLNSCHSVLAQWNWQGGRPLGESIAAFIEAARMGAASLVRPEEARRALETALLIEDAAAPLPAYESEPAALYA